jgi:hypothetical protein
MERRNYGHFVKPSRELYALKQGEGEALWFFGALTGVGAL